MTEDVTFQGGVNVVRLRDGKVHRPATPASAAIHRLLRHVRAAGFSGAPQAFGFGGDGDEILEFLPGEVCHDLPASRRTPRLLGSVGGLLRQYHAAAATFEHRAGDVWALPAQRPAEVICHGDVAPYNTVLSGDAAVSLIDFDAAHLGPRRWDLAYAVYRFAGLHAPGNPDRDAGIAEQARRAAVICAGYGTPFDGDLVELAIRRLEGLMDFMRRRAAAGDAAFAGHIEAGHLAAYEADARYLDRHRAGFLAC